MNISNADHAPDCYEVTENEIVDSIINLQEQIEYLLLNWEHSTDFHYKAQIANEITTICRTQKELKKWLLNEKIKLKLELKEPEEIYLNYC